MALPNGISKQAPIQQFICVVENKYVHVFRYYWSSMFVYIKTCENFSLTLKYGTRRGYRVSLRGNCIFFSQIHSRAGYHCINKNNYIKVNAFYSHAQVNTQPLSYVDH